MHDIEQKIDWAFDNADKIEKEHHKTKRVYGFWTREIIELFILMILTIPAMLFAGIYLSIKGYAIMGIIFTGIVVASSFCLMIHVKNRTNYGWDDTSDPQVEKD